MPIVQSDFAVLRRLAALHGIQSSYVDAFGRRQVANSDSLIQVLRALRVPIERSTEAVALQAEHLRMLTARLIEPVIVSWRPHQGTSGFSLHIDNRLLPNALHCEVELEEGGEKSWTAEIMTDNHGSPFVPLPRDLPLGYHQLHVRVARTSAEALLIVAPRRVFRPNNEDKTSWGVFLPLYALHSARSWGSGDFTDLETLLDWVAELGGDMVGTLPMLANFLSDGHFDPSPYAPISRLFWSELYVDPAAAPEFAQCEAARDLIASAAFQRELDTLRSAPLVDYRRQMALKRQVLELLAKNAFEDSGSAGSERRNALDAFLNEIPLAKDYARFRAMMETYSARRQSGAERPRHSDISGSDYDPDSYHYHLYAQWLAHEQLTNLARSERERGRGLYLDLPLGVHADGYDIWRSPTLFTQGVSAGAPPDPYFTKGQDWGFPPLHSEQNRLEGHKYFIMYLRQHLRYGGILRIDHIMWFHRLFLIPHGMEPHQGVYVRFPAEELYAILALESHRTQSIIVGENLGTVPGYANRALTKHGLYGMYVVQYEAKPRLRSPLPPVQGHTVASLNTHDLPTFAAFLSGLDIDERVDLGILNRKSAALARRERAVITKGLSRASLRETSDTPVGASTTLTRATLRDLATSPASTVLVNLEDLWGETEAQNVPSTFDERPNWRRKARYSFEAFSRMPDVTESLREIDRARHTHHDTPRSE